ncbi:heterokaryon incompatibility protein-domain-containing protein [Xylaria sp. FL0933]|nr:heterokaryon incompatibility protein-domain-containing protein [Xylaria sp. FL0933]
MPRRRFKDMLKFKAQNANNSSERFNRVPLCQECRGWEHIGIHHIDDLQEEDRKNEFTTRQVATVEQLAQRAQCGICTCILAAYHARAQYLPNVQSRPAASIGIGIDGPFYLDTGAPGFHSATGRLPRLSDRSDPNYIVVKTFLRLTVRDLLGPKRKSGLAAQLSTSSSPSQTTLSDEYYASPELFVITPQFKLAYTNDDAKILTWIQEWEVPYFDTKLLSEWLGRCEEHHGAKCGGKLTEKGNLPTGFRVIDTLEERITEPEGPFRYVALSYMWAVGPDNNVQLEKSNADLLAVPLSLRQVQLPNIISDAITLCRDLGERYLWIDRLCIIQDDQVTKPGQINAMDTIYRSASFMIIGALNTRDDVGLPGCAGRPRNSTSSTWPAPYEPEVESMGLICGSTTDKAIDTTLWNQRGWTFQERLLSSRCLYITHNQVIYKCCQEEATEILTWAIHSASSSPEEYDHQKNRINPVKDHIDSSKDSTDEPTYQAQSILDDGIAEGNGVFKRGNYDGNGRQFTFQDGVKLSDYCDWVKDYSSRQLSVASDSFNAFAGVGNALRESFNCRMLFGIPEKYIAICLCWDSPGPFSARGALHHVPSWSWVSSSSAATYDCEGGTLGRDFLHIASIVYFYYQQPDGDLQKLDVEERWIQHEISIEELAQREELPPLLGKGIPGEWRTNEDWRECPQNPWATYERQALDPDARILASMFPGSLVFNTTVASLKIAQSPQLPNGKEESNICDAILVNTHSERVGSVRMMDRRWLETNYSSESAQKPFEFAVISGRLQEYFARKMLAWEERFSDIWELNVMMVERLPCKPFVARRIGIGRVTMCKWKDCSPRWETVVLC